MNSSSPTKDTRWFVLCPFILAAYPVCTIYADNIREVTITEALFCLGVSLLVARLTLSTTCFVAKSRERGILAACFFLLSIFCYSLLNHANDALELRGASWHIPTMLGFVTWCIFSLAGVVAIARGSFRIEGYLKFAGGLSAVLGSLTVLALGLAISMSPWLWQEDRPAIDRTEDIQLLVSDSPRDIYYLVFDRYGSESTLKNDFGFDNAPFLNGLQSRGFHVAADSQANYPKTELSMTAALNMQYHDGKIWPKCCYDSLLHENRVADLLSAQGYRYYLLGNLHNGLRRGAKTDYNYRFSATESELGDQLIRMTPASALLPETDEADRALEKFARIAEIAGEATPQNEPKFVYAHFMLPHEPWKFGRDGQKLTTYEAAQHSETENYVNQLQFTNRQIEKMVDEILNRSKRPPIIIIQSDEGPELRYEHDESSTELAKLRKRCGIISALYLPERNAAEIVPRDLSPVNTFRLVFREYFQADIALLPNRTFYWSEINDFGKPDLTKPCEFVEVTDQVHPLNIVESN